MEGPFRSDFEGFHLVKPSGEKVSRETAQVNHYKLKCLGTPDWSAAWWSSG